MDRFWSKVQKTDGCWLWVAACDLWGYGTFYLKGQMRHASRVAWELTRGPIPPGLCVLHSCDNPPCCNPAHLFLGTNADNTADMCRKGRDRRPPSLGAHNGNAMLTDEQVLEIRQMCSAGETCTAIATIFGVTRGAISHIKNSRSWQHLG